VKLSERLEVFVRGQCTDPQLRTALEDAWRLAKRYEDAPVGELLDSMERSSIVNWCDAPTFPISGQRVRILLDTEGV
jgi:hypothetical protein